MHRVLFICIGNICRSPTAHGLFQHWINQSGLKHLFEIDSAGIHAVVGAAPDHRAQRVARAHNIDLSTLVARQLTDNDFEYFQHIVVMDRDNLHHIRHHYSEHSAKATRLMDFSNHPEKDVIDPYWGTLDDFHYRFEQIQIGCQALLDQLTTKA